MVPGGKTDAHGPSTKSSSFPPDTAGEDSLRLELLRVSSWSGERFIFFFASGKFEAGLVLDSLG